MEAICADQNAQNLLVTMLAEYDGALSRLSSEGKAILGESQQRWEERVAATCITFPNELRKVLPNWNSSPAGCFRDELQRRINFIAEQGKGLGGFVWQQIDRAEDLYCLSGKDERGINLYQLTWTWPRIDAPSSGAMQRWNEAHQISSHDIEHDRKDADPCDLGGYHNRGIAPIFVKGDLINIEYTEDWSGLAHGTYAISSSIESVSTGKSFDAEDFFKAGSGWQKFIAQRLFAESGSDEAENSLSGFEQSAAEVERWTVDEKTLTYSFDPYELGGYLSAMETVFTWKELRPYLRDDLPFQPDFN
jgi:hypothetical protein